MQFNAFIKSKSHVHISWESKHQIAGYVHGTKFSLVKGGLYVANDLDPAVVALLQTVPYVQIEAVGSPVGVVESAPEPQEDTPVKTRGRPKKVAVDDSDASLLE